MIFVLYVLACSLNLPPGERDCVVVIADLPSVAACRDLYQEIKATLPADMKLTFPECRKSRP